MSSVSSSLPIIIIVVAVIFALISFGAGVFCIVRYAKSRKTLMLVLGILLTFILPGIFLCVGLGVFIPSTMVVYGPPPSIPTTIVYGPPPSTP